MPQLRCLTIAAEDPKRLADFYGKVFELVPTKKDGDEAALSDGAFVLAFVKSAPDRPSGFYQIGYQVEDMERILGHFGRMVTKLAGGSIHVVDPDGNRIEASPGSYPAALRKTTFPIRHLALYTADPKRLANFYCGVFGMKEVAYSDRSSIFVSDGYFNVALLYQRVDEEKNGFNHFGFHVQDLDEMRDRAEGAGVRRGAKRPDRIPYAEYRLHDPEGNGIDISVKGWKV